MVMPDVKREGLEFVEITTDETNVASQRVIESNGGQLAERFHELATCGGSASLRYRIYMK